MITNLEIIKKNIEHVIKQTSTNEILRENFLVIQDACNELIEDNDKINRTIPNEWDKWFDDDSELE